MKESSALASFRAALALGTERLWVFSDREPWFRERCASELRAFAVGDDEPNALLLDGDALTPEVLSDALDAPPIFAERKFVRVRAFRASGLSEEDAGLYKEILSDVPEYAVLLLELAEGPSRRGKAAGGSGKSLLDFLKKHGSFFDFETPAPAEMARLLIRAAGDAGKELSPSDADYLVSLSAGSDTQSVMSEAEKLFSLPSREIRREDIDDLVTLSPDAAAYLISGAVFDGDLASALTQYRRQIRKGASEYSLSSLLHSDVRRYYAVKIGSDAGIPGEELASLLAISDRRLFVLKKIVARIDAARLRRAAYLAAENEYLLRSVSAADRTVLTEMLLIKLTVLLGRMRPGGAR
ncbi:MAG: hypothetical protein IKX85_04970 [Clostridia bacterium]|nr:hypothetical protein [Clostridia bacterium]